MTCKHPISDIDLYTSAHIQRPYPAYQRLRQAGPVTWLEHYQVWAVSTYRAAQVRADEPVWRINNTIRGIDSLPFTAQAA